MAADLPPPLPTLTDPPQRQSATFWQRRGTWLLLSALMILFVTVMTVTAPMRRMDRMLQDNARAAMYRNASDQIVVVAIDEKSLAAIGRWPWQRSLHAELLYRISMQSPRCIGLNLLLPESDGEPAGDDASLASAMRDSGCVVLPMARHSVHPHAEAELLPAPALAEAATAIGHAHLALDEDGIARSFYRREGFVGRQWPHFMRALKGAGDARRTGAPQPREPVLAPDAPLEGPWQRSGHELVVFTDGTHPFKTVSYIDVLQGAVLPDTFRDRYVLIGVTALDLGGAYATPAASAGGLMPAVLIFANILQGELSGRSVVEANVWQNLAFNLVPLVIVLLGLLWLPPLGVLALIIAMLGARLGLHVLRPWVGLQFAPAAGFIGLLTVYPLWTLMRLRAALHYLRQSTEQLVGNLQGLPPARLPKVRGDFLDQQMAATTAAALRMRTVHRLLRDGLNHLPDVTMVLDVDGRVMIANLAALHHWHTTMEGLLGRDAHELLGDIRRRSTGVAMLLPNGLRDSLAPILGEAEDARKRILLLRCVPFFDAANEHAGWLVSLVDITQMRQAQSQRDEALRFISHDIREPSASILTLIELARNHPETLTHATLMERIERHAQTGLELADGFVNVARAEMQPVHPEVLDLLAILQQCIDDAWAAARRRHVRVLLVSTLLDEALCIGDRGLITRAIANLLSNALKYSPHGLDVRCSITERPQHWAIGVQDHGPGIPVEQQSQLFQPFHRLHRESHPEVHGVGLGLLLVRTAVQRHGGSVEIDSALNAGCTMTLVLPKPSPAEIEEAMNSGDEDEA